MSNNITLSKLKDYIMKKDLPAKSVVDDGNTNYDSSSKDIDSIFDNLFFDDEEEDDPATSYPSSWKFPNNPNSSISKPMPMEKDLAVDVNGTVQPELKPKPKVFNISFDVAIGNPKRICNKIWVNNAQGKSIYLAPYRNIIQLSLELFNNNVRATYHNSLPRFMICGRRLLVDQASVMDEETELMFYGLYFDDNKIKASFLYVNEEDVPNAQVMELLNEIGETCSFYIVGEFEMDDAEEHIIGMEIESFDYFNPYRTDKNSSETLHRIT